MKVEDDHPLSWTSLIKCHLCNQENNEVLTGVELDFIGYETTYDKADGFTYVKCERCGVIWHHYEDLMIHWPQGFRVDKKR